MILSQSVDWSLVTLLSIISLRYTVKQSLGSRVLEPKHRLQPLHLLNEVHDTREFSHLCLENRGSVCVCMGGWVLSCVFAECSRQPSDIRTYTGKISQKLRTAELSGEETHVNVCVRHSINPQELHSFKKRNDFIDSNHSVCDYIFFSYTQQFDLIFFFFLS